MEKGLVSIITPIYNGENYITQTVTSVINQTFTNWELIIIDDGSTDKSATIIRELAKSNSKIQCLFQKNLGGTEARNNGIRTAKGQYMCMLDADDTWEPEFLKEQLDFMNSKKTFLVFCSHTRINEDSQEVLKPFIVPEKVTYHDLLTTCSISLLTGVYDSEPYGKVYFNQNFKNLRNDFLYWLEIIKKVKVGYGNPSVLANYRILKNSASRNKWTVIIPQFQALRNVEKLNLLKSLYYMMTWSVFGYLKYKK